MTLETGRETATVAQTTQVLEQDGGIASLAGKYLTFQLAGEIYGLEILKVQEIIGIMDVTRVPRTPDFVRGVINLRGKVIPVIDLRRKFEMESKEDTERTCIIVVQVDRGGRQVTMGILVDEVSEVLDVKAEQIEDSPEFGAGVNTDFIMGMGKVMEKVVMILDVNQVLTENDLSVVEQASQDE